jgi:ribosomal-protein-alanine N-acetyltransferase
LIRLATVADIPSMLDLERSSATAARWTERQYRELFVSGGARRLVLVAESPSLRASGGALKEGPSGPASASVLGFLVALHLAPEWELENIVVAASAQRQGLGKQLLNALLAAASEINSKSVFLEVRESNGAARGFYEKAGFEQTSRRKSYYSNPIEDAVLYRLTLDLSRFSE